MVTDSVGGAPCERLSSLAPSPRSTSGRSAWDPAVFQGEMGHILPSSWVFVCDVQEVGQPGSFVTGAAGFEPVLVLRDHEMGLRAFINVCPHRGSLLATGAGQCGKYLTCPYHGWSFTLDGKLRTMPHRDRWPSSPGSQHLHEVRLAVWRRFVFVNVSGNSEPLDAQMAGWEALLDHYPIQAAVPGRRIIDRCPVNWKLFSDINLDSFHIPTVHAATIAPQLSVKNLIMERGMDNTTSIGVFPIRPGLIKSSSAGPALQPPFSQGAVLLAHYPGFVLSLLSTGDFYITWWWPLDIAITAVAVMTYQRDGTTAPTPVVGPPSESIDGTDSGNLMQQVRTEDFHACARVQRAIHSRWYRPGPGHELELQALAFHEWLDGEYRKAGILEEVVRCP